MYCTFTGAKEIQALCFPSEINSICWIWTLQYWSTWNKTMRKQTISRRLSLFYTKARVVSSWKRVSKNKTRIMSCSDIWQNFTWEQRPLDTCMTLRRWENKFLVCKRKIIMYFRCVWIKMNLGYWFPSRLSLPRKGWTKIRFPMRRIIVRIKRMVTHVFKII